MSIIDELEKIQELKVKGILTEEEFEKEKYKILNNGKIADKAKKKVELVERPKELAQEKSIKEIKQTKSVTTNKRKFCIKCGNEILEGEKFCGKCGTKTKLDIEKKTKIKYIKISVIIVCIIAIFGVSGKIYYDNTTITDEYIVKYLKEEKGFEQFDDVSIKILATEDIDYNNLNKLVINNMTISKNGNTFSQVGILLINRKNNQVESFTISNNLSYILNSLVFNSSKAQEVARVSAKYIQNNGIEILNSSDTENFRNYIKEISNIIGVEEARKSVNEETLKLYKSNNMSVQVTNLFEKESAFVKYVAFYETKMEFNSSYPISESEYKLMEQYSSNSNGFFRSLQELYGPAYKLVNKYTVYETKKYTDEKEFEKNKVGTYNSLDNARKKLNVD